MLKSDVVTLIYSNNKILKLSIKLVNVFVCVCVCVCVSSALHNTQNMNTQSTSISTRFLTCTTRLQQDVLTIRSQVEVIHYSENPTSMTTEEWKLINEIVRSTIWMHLAENVYFSMAKETTTFSLWEKLQAVYKKKSSSKFDIDPIVIQHEDERDEPNNIPHQHLQSGVI